MGLCAMLLAGGCGALGTSKTASIKALGFEMPAEVYKGLAGQTCAVMVYTDFAAKSDFPTLRVDVGRAVQQNLIAIGQKELKAESMAGAVFPYPADSVARFQDEHPDTRFQPVQVVAQRLGIPNLTRLIYVEVHEFQTRFANSQHLYRGQAVASLRVVEIRGKTATVVFQEDKISATFPPAINEALPLSDEVNDQSMYQGTLGVLTQALGSRFYEIPE